MKTVLVDYLQVDINHIISLFAAGKEAAHDLDIHCQVKELCRLDSGRVISLFVRQPESHEMTSIILSCTFVLRTYVAASY